MRESEIQKQKNGEREERQRKRDPEHPSVKNRGIQ